MNVYYLEHADAAEVAKVLDGVVKGTLPHPLQPLAHPRHPPLREER